MTYYRSVVVARLIYAASAWHGFCKATDNQRINSLFTRAKRCGYCAPDSPTFEESCETADEQLVDKITLNCNHVLIALLPPPSVASRNYNLRRRPHTLTLPAHNTSLSDCNFITRIPYKECYNWFHYCLDCLSIRRFTDILLCLNSFVHCLAFCQVHSIKRIWWWCCEAVPVPHRSILRLSACIHAGVGHIEHFDIGLPLSIDGLH